MNILNILPPLILFALFGDYIKQALLAEILNQYILALNKGALVVHRAVATIGEAFLSLEFGVATGAGPGDKSWSEGYLIAHELVVVTEVPHEVKCLIISGSIPELPIHFVILVL